MRFRLRTLLAAMAVVAVAIAYAMSVLREYHAQLRTVHNLYATSVDAGWTYIPPHYEVKSIALTGPIDIPSAQHAASLPYLGSLHLDNCTLLPGSLEIVASLRDLQELGLSHSSIGDDDLAKLRPMTGLRYLHLSGTNVTDEGIERLREALPGLEVYDD